MTTDELATKLKGLINGWNRRFVPYQTWVDAWDIVEEMVVLDMERAIKASELLMGEYEKWVDLRKEGPDEVFATRVEQGVLL